MSLEKCYSENEALRKAQVSQWRRDRELAMKLAKARIEGERDLIRRLYGEEDFAELFR